MFIRRTKEPGALKYTSFFFYKAVFSDAGPGEMSRLRAVFVVTLWSTMLVTNMIYISLGQKIEPVLENLKMSILQSMLIFVTLNEYFNGGRLKRLYDYVDKSMANPRYGFTEEKEIMDNAVVEATKEISLYATMFMGNCVTSLLTKSIVELLNGRSWKVLPFPWSITAEEDGDFRFYTAYIFQIYHSAMSHAMGTVGMASTTILKQLIGLFNTVLLGIERIEERAIVKMKNDHVTYEQSMESCLQESIAHYEELIKEVVSIRPHLEATFVSLIAHISLVMACECFPLLMDDCSFATGARCVAFLMVQMICTAVICERNEIMSDKNVEVCWAVYNSKWFNYDVIYQRLVLNILTVSNKPLAIKGVFFKALTATRATFYSAMVNAFNILNMIRRIV